MPVLKKTRTTKKGKKPDLKIDMHTWKTSDADEIARRKLRAENEQFQVENIDLSVPYYSTYYLSTNKEKKYCVEIRSLIKLQNSCDCPDYRSNGLGTCKHIEHILFRLKKKAVRAFKQAVNTGSPYIEIYLNPVNEPTIQVTWPTMVTPHLVKLIDPFFSSDGSLIGDPIVVFSELEAKYNSKRFDGIRISRHIPYFLDYQRINAQKQSAKNRFIEDVELGKRTMDLVKYPLLPYQQEGILHLVFTERALLADEMGLGKTVQAIAASELLRQLRHVQRVLVVTTASLKAEWEEQIAKFTDLSSLSIFGTRAKRLKQYQQNAFFYLLNYEQVVSDYAEIQRMLAPDVIILDEAQRIKNWQTKTAAAIKELKSRYAFVLTGTPIENRIDDIYSLVQFLDPHVFGSLFRFNRDFYVLDDAGKPTGYKNLDGLYRRLRPIMLCRKKIDVEDELPQRLNNNYFVTMSSEQRIRYEEYEVRVARLVQQAKRRPLRKEEFERMQQWLACMRMICDTPFILDKDCRISPKLDELTLILDDLLVLEENKIIIFSEWERMLTLVKEAVEERGIEVAWHTGKVPQQKRREMIQRFKQDANCRLFLSTDSGSVGLNLQVANVVINLDLPWNPAKLEQRIARAWRKHQKRSVQVINLISENSIEHRMLYLLEKKQLLANGVLTGEGDLSEMTMPSGRAAFIERMETLMGDVPTDSTELVGTPATSLVDDMNQRFTSAEEVVRQTMINVAGTNFDLFNYQNITQQTSIFLAVCKDSPEQMQEQVQRQLPEEGSVIELIDRKTFEAIQRLVDAGVLNFKVPGTVIYEASSTAEIVQIQQKQIERTKQYLTQAERKQKMAHILIEGEFAEEAVAPLREAFKLSTSAFSQLLGLEKEEEKIDFTLLDKEKFLQEVLVDQYGMPDQIIPLFSQLIEQSNEIGDIRYLHNSHQQIISYVHEQLTKRDV